MDYGVRRSFDEVCMPIKVFYGHVESLKEDVDHIFIPRIASMEEGKYNCPKFLGLSFVAEHSFVDLPSVIDVNMDANEGRMKREIKRLGKKLGKKRSETKAAYEAGVAAQEAYDHYMQDLGYFPKDAFRFVKSGKRPPGPREGPREGQLAVGLVGHPYNLFDKYVNLGLFKKLEEMGAWLTTAHNVPKAVTEERAETTIPFLWEFTGDIAGAAFYFAEDPSIDGVIFVTSFGCGPDSMFVEVVQNRMTQYEKPFMILTIDEHTAEAGMMTRIEAFVDMIRRR